MTLRNDLTGEEKQAIIELMSEEDFKIIRKKKDQFHFNWNKYKGKEVFKLRLLDEPEILGLMCITDHNDPATNAVEIELLEVGTDNIGKDKKFEKIAGCLIAFACRESFKRGHDGFLFLTPKTALIDHYSSEYGLEYLPPVGLKLEGLMVANSSISIALIRKYLN
jgi:hypothetical protein